MPIYEYVCGRCGRKFEQLLRGDADDSKVSCPGCDAREARRIISGFSCGTGGGNYSGDGGCGPAPSG